MGLRVRDAVLVATLLGVCASRAQVVTGTIAAEGGAGLPFATVTVAGGSGAGGATAGLEGVYALRLDDGATALDFDYVGYATARRVLPEGLTAADTLRLDVALAPARYTLPEAAVSAGGVRSRASTSPMCEAVGSW